VPAAAVATSLIFMVLVPVAAEQPPDELEVNVNVIVPVKAAAGVYVTAAGVAV